MTTRRTAPLTISLVLLFICASANANGRKIMLTNYISSAEAAASVPSTPTNAAQLQPLIYTRSQIVPYIRVLIGYCTSRIDEQNVCGVVPNPFPEPVQWYEFASTNAPRAFATLMNVRPIYRHTGMFTTTEGTFIVWWFNDAP